MNANLIISAPIDNHKYGSDLNNFKLEIENEPNAPETKNFSSRGEYMYALTEYVKKYVESKGIATVNNNYNPKQGEFYHMVVKLLDGMCTSGLKFNQYSNGKSVVPFKFEFCNDTGCNTAAKNSELILYKGTESPAKPNDAITGKLSPLSNIDLENRSLVITKHQTPIYNQLSEFIKNANPNTILGFAYGIEKGVQLVITRSGNIILVDQQSVRYA